MKLGFSSARPGDGGIRDDRIARDEQQPRAGDDGGGCRQASLDHAGRSRSGDGRPVGGSAHFSVSKTIDGCDLALGDLAVGPAGRPPPAGTRTPPEQARPPQGGVRQGGGTSPHMKLRSATWRANSAGSTDS